MADMEEQGEQPREPEDRESVIKKVQDQLELLMSKENLQEDGFMQINMNAQMQIPICILGSHHQIEALGPCADISTILEAALRSESLIVDKEDMLVRPVIKTKRNIVILHDLPDGVPEEELKALFDTCPTAKELVSVKPDVNHTAFVTFQNDTAAQDAALWLRSQKLHGGSIKCSIKSEQFLRSFFPMPGMSGAPTPGMPPWAMAGSQAMIWGGAGWPGQQWGAIGQDMYASTGAWAQGEGTGEFGKDGKGKGVPEKGVSKGSEKGSSEKGTEKGSSEKGSPGMGYEKGSFDKGYEKGWDKGKGKGKGKGKRGKSGSPMHGPMGPIDRELAQMEAMQQQAYQAALEAGGEQAMEMNEEDLGYKHEFRRYTRQQIIEACSGMEEVEKPESYKKMEARYPDLALFRQSPNKDWAPLPTPMTSFASSFLGGPESRRTSSMDESGDGWGDGDRGRSRKDRSNTWAPTGPRSSRSRSADVKEESGSGDWDWDAWPESKKGGGWRSSRRWSWDDSYNSGGGGPQWVEKSKASTEGAEEDSESKCNKEQWVAKRPSWAEKVKGGVPTQKWQAKSKPTESQETPESSSSAAGATEAAAPQEVSSGEKQPDASGEEKKEEEKEEEASGTSKAPTWADKVRKASGS